MYGYSPAWLHHKGRNKHHFEYWNDYNPKYKKVMPVEMPLNYLIEMFCDRVSASKIYQGEKYTDAYPLEYYLKSTNRFIHPNTASTLESWLVMLRDEGEEKTFAYIKIYTANIKSRKRNSVSAALKIFKNMGADVISAAPVVFIYLEGIYAAFGFTEILTVFPLYL